MRQVIASLILFLGCAHPELNDRDALTVAVAEHTWDKYGMPSTEGCAPLEVKRHNTMDGYVSACSKGFPDFYKTHAANSAGCIRVGMYGVLSKTKFTIHIAPKYHEDAGLVAHEAFHYLIYCTDSKSGVDRFDAYHSDETVWGELEPEARKVL